MTSLRLPPADHALSPFTGCTREHWAAVADHLLTSVRPYFSGSRSRVALPGRVSSYGADSDGLEGYARTFMLYAFRTHGEGGADPLGLTAWYRDGLLAGTDPANPERWPTGAEIDQVKVEAASLALGLQLTRPWLWDTLTAPQRDRVIAFLATCPGGWYPDNNWLWFRLTVETFLASVGGPHDPDRMRRDLATLESYFHTDGWYSDGPVRAYDYYCGWAMHVYPLLWTASRGADENGGAFLEPVFRGRLATFLDDYVHLIGADGLPVLQGRSLTYRFAAAAPLWMGAITGATRQPAGVLRRAASGILAAFVERGAIDERGLLTLGLFGEWPGLAQSYSGSGSPYWTSKGLLGLMLPAGHPVWTAVEEPLPVERGDVRRVIRPAGWLISGTAADGLVRVCNHGTDHALPGARDGDSPLYARYGYSSATIPPLTGGTIASPADNALGAVGPDGGMTHRTGFLRGIVGDDGTAAYATSIDDTHWVDSRGDTRPDHGSGRTGDVTDGPRLATASIVRGPWEVRVARRLSTAGVAHDGFADAAPAHLRISGWPVAGTAIEVSRDAASGDAVPPGAVDALEVCAEGLVSGIDVAHGSGTASVHTEEGTSPLGDQVAVPRVDFPAVAVGEAVAALIWLRRVPRQLEHARPIVRLGGGAVPQAIVSWPDGTLTAVTLPH